MDLGTRGGEWLFKDRDLLMGPVPASSIIEKLGKGEITPETMVASEDEGQWKHLRDFSFFKVHVARAQARSRVMREKDDEEQATRRSRRNKTVVISIAAIVLVLLVSGGAWWWVTSRRIGENSKELAEIGITVSPPVIALASLSRHLGRVGKGAFLDVDVPDSGGTPPSATGKGRPGGRRPSGNRPSGRPGRPAGAAASAGSRTPAVASTDPDGLRTAPPQYDMGHIQRVLKKQSSTLFPCIKDEVRRTGFKGAIPFEFVVTNAGRVGKIWLDNRQLRGTPLEACFQKTMAQWRFKPFAGERPTVSQSFTIR